MLLNALYLPLWPFLVHAPAVKTSRLRLTLFDAEKFGFARAAWPALTFDAIPQYPVYSPSWISPSSGQVPRSGGDLRAATERLARGRRPGQFLQAWSPGCVTAGTVWLVPR